MKISIATALLPTVGMMAIMGISATVPFQATIIDVPHGNVPTPASIEAVAGELDCVVPSAEMDLRYLDTMIVADEATGKIVSRVTVDEALAGSKAGTYQILLACAR